MIELTDQQLLELHSPRPIAIDPRTKVRYVLIREDVYERLQGILALDDYDPDEGAGYISEIMAEDDAHDPYLEGYQHYGKRT